jgi:hypothetical protein
MFSPDQSATPEKNQQDLSFFPSEPTKVLLIHVTLMFSHYDQLTNHMRKFKKLITSLSLGVMLLGMFSLATASEGSLDTDRDGLTNAQEYALGTNPYKRDTDGDQYPDGFEVQRGSLPKDIKSVPSLISISHERSGGAERILISVYTFSGKNFQIEHCPIARNWKPVGNSVMGDGGVWQSRIPVDSLQTCGFFRVSLTDSWISFGGSNRVNKPGVAGDTTTVIAGANGIGDNGNGGNNNNNGGDDDCDTPDDVEDLAIELDDSRRFSFGEDGAGHVTEHEGADYIFTPFTYTFRKKSGCKAEIIITYPSDKEVPDKEIIVLDFENHIAGSYTSSFYEGGELDSSSSGDFAIVVDDIPFGDEENDAFLP